MNDGLDLRTAPYAALLLRVSMGVRSWRMAPG
jgi:hypothetical protein